MDIMTEKQIIGKINSGQLFAAEIEHGGFQVRVNHWNPALATAIHDGHRVIEALADKMKVSDTERRFEEDPHTGTIAETMAISITVLNSRYCGDLNRPEDRCVYDDAWGKQVWKEPLAPEERELLLDWHRSYYRVLDALLANLVERFGAAVLYDLHSYNYERINGAAPLFNIGTHYIDMGRFERIIKDLAGNLQAISIPGCENRTALNEVFEGRGYQAAFTHRWHPDVLCVPLELKKVFMDEQSFAIKREVYEPLFAGTAQALQANAEFFMHWNG